MVTFCIVLGYLVGTFLLAFLLKRKSGKKDTVQSMFAARGTLPLLAVTCMLFGDMVAGSSTTGTAGTGFSTGVAAGWAVWGSSFGCLLYAAFFVKYFFSLRGTGITSCPEALGIRFNQGIRYLTLAFLLIPQFIIFTVQISAASMYLTSMLGINPDAATLITVCLFLGMALLGLTGVAQMNKVHSFVIFFGIMFAAIVCLNYVGGPGTLVEKLPPSYFNPFANGVPTVVAQFLGSALGFSLSVTSVNIGFSAKSVKVARRSEVIVFIASCIFVLFPMAIGLCGAVTLDPGIRADTVLFAMTSEVSPVLSGIAVMAVFAAIFSTGPWFLLAMSNMIVRDIYMPTMRKTSKPIDGRKSVFVAKASMVVTIIAAVPLSGGQASFLSTLMSAAQITAVIPLLLIVGLHWKRLTNLAGFVGLCGGGVLATVWYFLGLPFGIQGFWPAAIFSLASFFTISMIQCRERVSEDYLAFEGRLAKAKEDYRRSISAGEEL